MMEKEIEKYIKAGKITANVLEFARTLILSGINDVCELCEEIESKIFKLGGMPAFPCNICINEIAAHFSPYPSDRIKLPKEGIVKIDVGVRIDGFITDAAISIPLSKNYKKIVKCSKKALENAIKCVKPGIKTGKLGEIIEKTAKDENFKPIKNLSGHLIREYNLHAGKSIPNIRTLFSQKIEEGEIYAIEPFLTFPNAMGSVTSINKARIFSLAKLKKPRNREGEEIYREIYRRFRTLPFSPRWLLDLGPLESVLEKIRVLIKEKIVHAYPVLVEESGGYVAQFEHTVLVTKRGGVILTKKAS